MKYILIQLLLVILIFNGCIPSESEHNLGNGYYLLGDDRNTTISKIYNNNPVFYDDIILGQIVDYNFDKNFIVIFRNASSNAKIYFNLQDSLWNKQQGKDSLQYWIIEKNDNILIGPLEKSEYLLKRQQLNIPNNLHLKSIKLF